MLKVIQENDAGGFGAHTVQAMHVLQKVEVTACRVRTHYCMYCFQKQFFVF